MLGLLVYIMALALSHSMWRACIVISDGFSSYFGLAVSVLQAYCVIVSYKSCCRYTFDCIRDPGSHYRFVLLF